VESTAAEPAPDLRWCSATRRIESGCDSGGGISPLDPRRGRRDVRAGPATKIYIAVESVDMRKGFDGL